MDCMESRSPSAEDVAEALRYELKRSWSLLFEELALLDGLGDVDFLLPLQSISNPLNDEGDPPLERDTGRSDRDVRRLGGTLKEKPASLHCQTFFLRKT
jgi:hypothetical protein